jgi:YidC/Oxa1 family membrane protein insertase
MNFFETIFFPFIEIIKYIFLFSYDLTGNYGISIILLSLFISLLLLPIFVLIEKSKKKDDAIKQKMKPFVDEIKRCYKGQERFYYLKTLNRQYNYSPTRALIPLLSLLLQIPFFIAAYQYLENFEPLRGVGFWFIKDLSVPDGLFGSVHFLPIAMTIVNLITAFFYTRNGNTSERKQMLIVAAIFLVLLFNLPSGLVLYWTMNNVFSFFRLFITNPEVFRIKESQDKNRLFTLKRIYNVNIIYKIVFGTLLLLSFIFQINWSFHHSFDDIVLRLSVSFISSFAVVFIAFNIINHYKIIIAYLSLYCFKNSTYFVLLSVSIYFYFAGYYYFVESNNSLLIVALVMLIPVQILGILKIVQLRRDMNTYVLAVYLVILSFIIFLQTGYSNSIISTNVSNIFSLINESRLYNALLVGYFFVLFTFPIFFRNINFVYRSNNKSLLIIFLLAVFYLNGFVFLFNPLAAFSSFPEVFQFAGKDILANNFYLFIVSVVVAISVYLISPVKIKKANIILFLSATIVGFIHNTLLPINMGIMHEGLYENTRILSFPLYYYFVEISVIIGIINGIYFLVKKAHYKIIIIGLILINAILISQSLFDGIESGSFLSNKSMMPNAEASIRFSKTKKNVLYLIPDMFQGWSMNRMMNENPQMRKQLEGFTWYPNTIAISRVTNTSIAPMLGGENYLPDLLDLDTEYTVREKVSAVSKELSERVKNIGYTFTSNQIPYTTLNEKSYDTFIPYWHDDWNKYNGELGFGTSKETYFSILWQNALFYSAPFIFKSAIYNEGKWINNNSKEKANNNYLKKHNFLRLLPYISTANISKGNFVLLYSLVSHDPWAIVDDSGEVIKEVSPYENNLWTMKTFIKWFDWMKENDVYDNTKIIIVSDHGAHWFRYKPGIDIDNPFTNIDSLKVHKDWMMELNPVLLVKDYNSNFLFKEDMRFMSNVDASSIALNDTNLTHKDPPDNRTLPAFISYWTKDMDTRNKFKITRKFTVKNSIFDDNNWTVEKNYY